MSGERKAVSEKPILFSGPMVRAILEGRKTQTRRVVKSAWQGLPLDNPDYVREAIAKCPYGQPGDRLWVRESWNVQRVGIGKAAIGYRAGGDLICALGDYPAPTPDESRVGAGRRWRPSIHMPRWASRITLEITAVRVERLSEISDADAIAEGYENRRAFLKGQFALTTKTTAWVWVIEFKEVERAA